jgi:hypothetical protein
MIALLISTRVTTAQVYPNIRLPHNCQSMCTGLAYGSNAAKESGAWDQVQRPFHPRNIQRESVTMHARI